MKTKLILSTASLLVALGIAGCSSDNVRSKLWVMEINETSALASDVYNFGQDGIPSGDDFILEDEVPISIIADGTPGSFVVRGGAYSLITIDSYDVEFESSEEVPGFSATLGWNVEVGTIFNGSLTLVPAGMKLRPPLSALQTGGEIRSNAFITFHATESHSGNSLTFETSIPVNFANWTDPD